MDLKPGDKIFVRTVTNYYTGEFIQEETGFIGLKHAAWVADTGYLADAMAKGTLTEVEAYPEHLIVWVSLGAVVDICAWEHELPKTKR